MAQPPNARKDKTGGIGVRMNRNDPEENREAAMTGRGRIVNPNDPEDNPEAVMLGRGGPGSESNDHRPVAPPTPLHHHSRKAPMDMTRQRNSNGSFRSIASESGSEINNSGKKPNKKRGSAGSSTSSDRPTRRGTSVPKFGTWDEKDPASGDGFTVIFNRVKEEKHNASSYLPTPPHHNTYSNTHQKHKSKVRKDFHIPADDFQSTDHYKEVLKNYSIDKFEKLKQKMIQSVDEMLGYEIPELLKNFRNPYERRFEGNVVPKDLIG